MFPDRLVLDLLREKVGLVEKQDDGNAAETTVVGDRVEYVYALDDSVCHAVLQETLVEGTRGHHEQNRGDFVETLKPLLSLGSLAAHVDKLERDALDVNVVFLDAAGGFT